LIPITVADEKSLGSSSGEPVALPSPTPVPGKS